jgi:uncharacterized protein (TIGR03435 family)
MGPRTLAVLGFFSALMVAQTPNGQPAFEAASIKPTTRAYRTAPDPVNPTLFICTVCDLTYLVTKAYGVPYFRISNPESYEKGNFDVSARMANGTTPAQFQLMLQNLLAERFKLAIHREIKERSTFTLTVVKGGPKMRAHVEGIEPETSRRAPGIYFTGNHTMAELVTMLESRLRGPVTDATGLTGTFDFDLSWSVQGVDQQPDIDPDAALFSAIKLQLGLQLSAGKGKVEVLVIDHAEKTPTGN